MILGAGETAYAEGPGQVLQHTGATVTYQQSSMFAFGRPAFMVGAFAVNAMANSAARRRAEAQAAAQWRWCDSGALFLTDQRLALQGSRSWTDWWFGALRAVNTDHDSLLMYVEGAPPTMLRCPTPGWWYVALHWLFQGTVPDMAAPPEVLAKAAAIRRAEPTRALERPRPVDASNPYAPPDN